MGDSRVWFIVLVVAALAAVAILFRKNESKIARVAVRISEAVVVAVVVVVLLRAFVFGVYIIPSESMVPTLKKGDYVVVNKFVLKMRAPRHGDVVVFQAPDNAKEGSADEDFIKRIVGLPGEVIQVWDGSLYRNGKKISERYIKEPIDGGTSPVKVPDGTVFVMGDNRNDSFDSRDFGPLDRKLIIGRANMILLPTNRIGYIRWR